MFEEMPVPRALARIALPTIVSQIILLAYNIADTAFIGMTGDPYMVAASSIVFPVFNMCIAFADLFCTGGGTLMSRLLGAKDTEEARRVCGFSVWASAAVALVFSLSMFLFMTPILRGLGASDNTVGHAADYAFWTIVVGALPTVMTISLGALLRAVGCAGQAGFGFSMGCLLNIALDPLCMFVLFPKGREVEGAAFATMLSNCASMLYFLWQYRRLSATTALTLSPRGGLPTTASIKSVLTVGVPSAIAVLLYDATNMTIFALSASHSDIALAAIGIVIRAERLPINICVGISLGMMPLLGYSFGASNFLRMRSTLATARKYGIIVSLTGVALYELFAPWIMQAFINDADTVRLGTEYMRVRCLASMFMFLSFNFVFFFQAVGMGRMALMLAVIRQVVFNIPLLVILERYWGMSGVIATQCIADALTTAVSVWCYVRTSSKKAWW